MKYYLSQLQLLLTKIEKKAVKALLIYGPDKGYIKEVCNILQNKFNMLAKNITYAEFTTSDINLILDSNNFFNQRELIKITEVGNSLVLNVEKILKHDFYHFPVLIADELKSDGAIRKFFEKQDALACLACYHDDEQNTIKFILRKLSSCDKKIDEEALAYLRENLKGDHELINNELEKLIYFIGERKEITTIDVSMVISNNLLTSSDEMCIYFASNDLGRFLKEVNKIHEAGTNEVLIIRALIRYYTNLYIVLSKVSHGSKLEDTLKGLSPPIFYKYINDFRKIANNINLDQVTKVIKILQEAEKFYKLSPHNFDFYQNIFAQINN